MPYSSTDTFTVLIAIALAAVGGELFLRGVLDLSAWLRLPRLLVATSISAFATSSPEFTVSTMAALAGTPEIGLGDALGSNVVNICLIFALALLWGPISAQSRAHRRDFLFAIVVPILTLILAFDGQLSRWDGALLLSLFALWVALLSRQTILYRHDKVQDALPVSVSRHAMSTSLLAVVGLSFLFLAGRLFVIGASGIASALGISSYIVGATVVALGTSLPELVTTLLARWRGHDDVGLGTLLGSNLFNGLAIVGTTAAIHPIQASRGDVSIALIFGVFAALLILPHQGVIPKQRGFMLLAVYAIYIVLTFSHE